MKLKRVFGALIGAALAVGMTVSACAAEIELGAFTWENNEQQKGWRANGCDSQETSLAFEDLQAATQIVLEVGITELAGDLQVVLQCDSDGWNWNQTDFHPGDLTIENGKLVIDIEKNLGKTWTRPLGKATIGKFIIAYYDTNMDDLKITRAYLVTPGAAAAPAAAAEPTTTAAEVKPNPPTGDTSVVFFAACALALASCAFGMFRKTRKSN